MDKLLYKTINETITKLSSLNEPVPMPLLLPDETEIESAENELGVNFHPDYRKYLEEASNVIYGVLEQATIPTNSDNTYIVLLAKAAWEMSIPGHLIPIAEDNGDYYCMDESGQVLFWSHDGSSDEKWPDLANWIEQVWTGRN
ncbi:MAG: SMI1/KNR4 family protein [Thiohalophilus sp.]|uniref:SMI1/KNR4 family protein n=1 Tax=Thiohalophilus sp. TaxID=3028392 RepID=UPI0028705484|nr:SMI1/KNR4 family protein [Thiohalophilus sp.]MDR9437192.1 SMI1/KNR4 family protein [Thiohalophilus sp.]